MLPKYRSILILFLSIDERMGGKERGRKEGEEKRKRKGNESGGGGGGGVKRRKKKTIETE